MAQVAKLRRLLSAAALLSRHQAAVVEGCHQRAHRRMYRGSTAPAAANPLEEMFPQRLTLPEDYGYVPMLSPAQVTAFLSVFEASAGGKAEGESAVRSFDSNQLASNSPVEDRRAVGSLLQTPGELFAVLDGHGGAACAQAVSERLLEYIAVSLLPPNLLEQYGSAMRGDQPTELVDYYHFREHYLSDDLEHVFKQSLQKYVVETLSFVSDDTEHTIKDHIKAAYERLDADISSEAAPVNGVYDEDFLQDPEFNAPPGIGGTKKYRPPVGDFFLTLSRGFTADQPQYQPQYRPQDQPQLHASPQEPHSGSTTVSTAGSASENQIALSGSCACVAHIDGTTVHVANAGDCRAVLGSIDPRTGGWIATPLSNDHNVDSDAEATRVRNAHPRNEAGQLFKNARLLGQLIPLRAFGDVRFKWPVKDLKHLATSLAGRLGQSVVPSYYHTPPYLIATPQVFRTELNQNDRFIIIASDGLWETMGNEKAVEIVGDHSVGMSMRDRFVYKHDERKTLGEINSLLRDRRRGLAYKQSDANGATHLVRHALGFDHRKVSEMLTLPAGVSRFYRDDITVTIIYLDELYLRRHAQPAPRSTGK